MAISLPETVFAPFTYQKAVKKAVPEEISTAVWVSNPRCGKGAAGQGCALFQKMGKHVRIPVHSLLPAHAGGILRVFAKNHFTGLRHAV